MSDKPKELLESLKQIKWHGLMKNVNACESVTDKTVYTVYCTKEGVYADYTFDEIMVINETMRITTDKLEEPSQHDHTFKSGCIPHNKDLELCHFFRHVRIEDVRKYWELADARMRAEICSLMKIVGTKLVFVNAESEASSNDLSLFDDCKKVELKTLAQQIWLNLDQPLSSCTFDSGDDESDQNPISDEEVEEKNKGLSKDHELESGEKNSDNKSNAVEGSDQQKGDKNDINEQTSKTELKVDPDEQSSTKRQKTNS